MHLQNRVTVSAPVLLSTNAGHGSSNGVPRHSALPAIAAATPPILYRLSISDSNPIEETRGTVAWLILLLVWPCSVLAYPQYALVLRVPPHSPGRLYLMLPSSRISWVADLPSSRRC